MRKNKPVISNTGNFFCFNNNVSNLYNNSVFEKKPKWYGIYSNYNFKIDLLIHISRIDCAFKQNCKYYIPMYL
jgi:hypothetical protein